MQAAALARSREQPVLQAKRREGARAQGVLSREGRRTRLLRGRPFRLRCATIDAPDL